MREEKGRGRQDCPLKKDELKGGKTGYIRDAKSREH
jgi:hypothetical protein